MTEQLKVDHSVTILNRNVTGISYFQMLRLEKKRLADAMSRTLTREGMLYTVKRKRLSFRPGPVDGSRVATLEWIIEPYGKLIF